MGKEQGTSLVISVVSISLRVVLGLAFAACLVVPVEAAEELVAEIEGQKYLTSDVRAAYVADNPDLIAQVRYDDNAARTLAVDWYRAQLFARGARDDGYFEANPEKVALANKTRDQFLAADYLTWLMGTKYKPADMELKQLYKLQPGLCASSGRVRLARAGVLWGKHASPEEIAAGEARFAKIQERLAAGEDFAVVADDASDFRTVGTGGDSGWVDIQTLQGNEMGEEVLALAPGERSNVISLPQSRGLIEMLDVEGAGTLLFEDCRPRLAEALSQRFRADVRRRRIDELAAKYKASMNLDAFIAVVRSIHAPEDPRVRASQP